MSAGRAWLLVAAAALGIGALCALALVVGRMPALGTALNAASWFRTVLVLHVDFVLLFWLWAALAAIASLELKLVARWPALLAAGCMMAALLAALAGGRPALSNYVPVIDTPLYLAALAGFSLAVALAAGPALRALARMPRGTAWALLAFLAALLAAIAGALQTGAMVGRARYEAMFWSAGHLLQFANVLLLMRLWERAGQRQGLVESALARGAFASTGAFALFGLLLTAALPAMDPGAAPIWTLLMAAGTWPGATLLIVLLWRKATDRKAFAAEAGPSAVLFFAGAFLGAVISGDNASVPAHYHAAVGALTLALMSAAPILTREAGLPWPTGRAARLQPWLFAAGALLLVAGLFANGLGEAPRKTPGAAGDGPAAWLFGIGGSLAVAAALQFCALMAKAWRDRLAKAAGPRADRRPFGIAVTAVLIGLVGGAIAVLPGQGPRLDPREQHVREMQLREIERRFNEGTVMLHAKRFDHALTAFHRVLELDPELPEAHVNAGFALLGLEKPAAARDFFQSAIELRPRQLNAYYGLAVALERMGDLPGARGAMRTYAHLAPPADPYRRKAEAALWEWESALASPR